MTTAQTRRIDKHMLESLATSFDMHANGRALTVSFHSSDIADLLRRCAAMVEPMPRSVENSEGK